MRTLSFLLLLVALPVAAHATHLSFHPIVNGNEEVSCNFNEPPTAGIRQVALFLYQNGGGVTGVRFGISEKDINWQRLWIQSPYTTVGSFDDLAVGFGSCVNSSAVVATLWYSSPSHSPCGTIQYYSAFQPIPIATLCDANYTEINLTAWHLTVNGVFDTPPGGPDPDCFCPPVATAPSTWGKVKSLYRE